MDKLFLKLPCLSESREFTSKEIYEKLFDKKVHKRFLETAIQKFIMLNKKMFDFLGIEVLVNGSRNDLTLRFRTSNLIGAIPIRMPYDGICHKDFQVVPRFDSDKDSFSELTQILSELDYSIKPEYADGIPLSLSYQLRPPLYYEAVKYIELFEKAYKYSWRKFEVVEKKHIYPKANTNWTKHAIYSSDPRKALLYPSRNSILSTDHIEWRKLKYVFNVSRDIIINATVPAYIRFNYQQKIVTLQKKTESIAPFETDHIIVHASDPICIKFLKQQANILLQKDSAVCMAWRMDMATLFERYVQHIVTCSIKELLGVAFVNHKISGKGKIPLWGLKYLEPDIMVKIRDFVFMVDTKYKAHFYAINTKSDVLKETHREDLHQILAYCSFAPQVQKTGLLFYPSRITRFQTMQYVERISGNINKVIICGIPFNITEMHTTIKKVKKIFQNEAC